MEQLGLGRRVFLTGYRTDVPSWLFTFDVFVLPTEYEPFGKVIIEAMAAGCPVVASRVGGIPEVIDRPEIGTLIPPDDPRATADAIVQFLDDHDKARRVGRAAAEDVRTRFGMNTIMQRLQSLYSEVLAAHSPR